MDPFDGRIILSGYATIGGNNRAALACATWSGAVCSGFGTGGKVAVSVPNAIEPAGFSAVAIQSNRKIVAFGSQSISGSPFNVFVARFESDGSPDLFFGNGEFIFGDFGTSDRGYGLIQKDPFCNCEKIIVSEHDIYPQSLNQWLIMRLLP